MKLSSLTSMLDKVGKNKRYKPKYKEFVNIGPYIHKYADLLDQEFQVDETVATAYLLAKSGITGIPNSSVSYAIAYDAKHINAFITHRKATLIAHALGQLTYSSIYEYGDSPTSTYTYHFFDTVDYMDIIEATINNQDLALPLSSILMKLTNLLEKCYNNGRLNYGELDNIRRIKQMRRPKDEPKIHINKFIKAMVANPNYMHQVMGFIKQLNYGKEIQVEEIPYIKSSKPTSYYYQYIYDDKDLSSLIAKLLFDPNLIDAVYNHGLAKKLISINTDAALFSYITAAIDYSRIEAFCPVHDDHPIRANTY